MIRFQSSAVQSRSSRLKAMMVFSGSIVRIFSTSAVAREAVEQLHQSAVCHGGFFGAGRIEIRQRDVAHALAPVLRLRFDGRPRSPARSSPACDQLAAGACGNSDIAQALDPVIDRLDLGLARLFLAVELLVAVVGHAPSLAIWMNTMRAVGIAGQHEIGIARQLIEMQHVAEILGGPRAGPLGKRRLAGPPSGAFAAARAVFCHSRSMPR